MYYHPNAIPNPAQAGESVLPQQSERGTISLQSRRLVFENSLFSVFADHVRDGSGNEVPSYLSVVPKHQVDDNIAGVAVLPVTRGAVGLVRVFRHPLGRWSWEVVKGHVDPGETVRAAAVRELREEIGYRISDDALVDFGLVTPESGMLQACTRTFAVSIEGLIGEPIEGELGHGDFRLFAPSELDTLVQTGGVMDASSLALVLKYRQGFALALPGS